MKLLFLGDISLHGIDYCNFNFDIPFKAYSKSHDLVIANLECPITDSKEKKKNQVINLSSSKESLCLIDFVDVVSLANNHIIDYQEIGAMDTISSLDEEQISHFGIGRSDEEALTPYIFKQGNWKVALLGATRYANHKKGMIGTASDNCSFLYKKVNELKLAGYFVIVYFHWGYEYVRIASPRERSIAHKCIDYGADCIIGSHPHVFQGIECYKGKQIVYSLGNFIFSSMDFEETSPDKGDPRLNNSFVLSLDIKDNGEYFITIRGYESHDNGIRLYSESENNTLLREIEEVSRPYVETRFSYLKKYYKQTDGISRQNSRVRNKFQKQSNQSLIERVSLYANANSQDLKNKIAGTVIGYFRKNA